MNASARNSIFYIQTPKQFSNVNCLSKTLFFNCKTEHSGPEWWLGSAVSQPKIKEPAIGFDTKYVYLAAAYNFAQFSYVQLIDINLNIIYVYTSGTRFTNYDTSA